MKENKSTIVFVLIIICLAVVIGLLFVKVNELEKTNVELTTSFNSTQEEEEEEQAQVITNLTADELTSQILSTGESLDLQSDNVQDLVDMVNFSTFAVGSIYNQGSFTYDNIPVDLVLRLAWDSSDSKSYIESDREDYSSSYATLSKNNMKKQVEKLFSSKVNYEDKDFVCVDVATFFNYYPNQGIVHFNDNRYEIEEVMGGGGDLPFIFQKVTDARVDEDGNINLIVKTAFIDTEYSNSNDEYNYIIYSNYVNDMFSGKVATIFASDFAEATYELTQDGSQVNITTSDVEPIDQYLDKLNTYVYSFAKGTDGNYYISSFNKVAEE